MKQNNITFANLYALRLGSPHNGLLGIRSSFGKHWFSKVFGHIQKHTAGYDWRNLFDTKPAQSVRLGKFASLKTIIVDMVDSDMAQSVNLAAYAEPPHVDMIIIGGFRRTQPTVIDLTRL